RSEGAVFVAISGIDLLGALGLEQDKRAARLPLGEILDGLKDREIGLHLAGGKLLLDLLVEPVAQPAGEGDLDAGKFLLELADPAIVRAGWTGAVEGEHLLELCLCVELVDALRGGRCRR